MATSSRPSFPVVYPRWDGSDVFMEVARARALTCAQRAEPEVWERRGIRTWGEHAPTSPTGNVYLVWLHDDEFRLARTQGDISDVFWNVIGAFSTARALGR